MVHLVLVDACVCVCGAGSRFASGVIERERDRAGGRRWEHEKESIGHEGAVLLCIIRMNVSGCLDVTFFFLGEKNDLVLRPFSRLFWVYYGRSPWIDSGGQIHGQL